MPKCGYNLFNLEENDMQWNFKNPCKIIFSGEYCQKRKTIALALLLKFLLNRASSLTTLKLFGFSSNFYGFVFFVNENPNFGMFDNPARTK